MKVYRDKDVMQFAEQFEMEFISFLWNTFKEDALMCAKFVECNPELYNDWLHNTKGESNEPTNWED